MRGTRGALATLGIMAVLAACATTEARKKAAVVAKPLGYFHAEAVESKLTSLPAADGARIRRLLAATQAREDELAAWALPLMRTYLPNDVEPVPRVYFAVGLPQLVFAEPTTGSVMVDIGSPVWGTAADEVFDSVVRVMYREALVRALRPGSFPAPETPTQLVDAVLARVQREGIIDYVASQGRAWQDARDSYVLAEQIGPLSDRFLLLDAWLDAQRAAPKAVLRERLKKLDEDDMAESIYAVVGAFMAAEIEAKLGRAELVLTMLRGPRNFHATYQRTGPGAMLSFQLPGAPPVASEAAPGLSSH